MECSLTKISDHSVIVSSVKKSVCLEVSEEGWFGFIQFVNRGGLKFVPRITIEEFKALSIGSITESVILSAHPVYLKLFPKKRKGPPPSQWSIGKRQ